MEQPTAFLLRCRGGHAPHPRRERAPKQRLKRGGNLERVDVEEVEIPAPMPDDDLLAMNDALDRLAELEPRAAEVVKLCFYVGLTQAQAAEHLGVSVATAERLWAFARAWLFQEIEKDRTPPA